MSWIQVSDCRKGESFEVHGGCATYQDMLILELRHVAFLVGCSLGQEAINNFNCSSKKKKSRGHCVDCERIGEELEMSR